MRLNNGSHDSETESNVARRDGAEWLVNQLEEPRQEFLLDPRAAIGDRHPHTRFARSQTDSD